MYRVAVTGMGVIAPNASGKDNFMNAIMNGVSGIKVNQQSKSLNLGCTVAGVPDFGEEQNSVLKQYLSPSVYNAIESLNIKYALCAAIEAAEDAGIVKDRQHVSMDYGCIFGTSTCDLTHLQKILEKVDNAQIRQLGVRNIEQVMTSGISAYIASVFGLAGRVYTNSSACATGTDSVLLAYETIRNGAAKMMIAGSSESPSHYIWANFDNMRILARGYNENPEKASRPMSAEAGGFVPAAGAGALVLEELKTARSRGARIYCEILGGAGNCGGHRNGGSMTNASSEGVVHCLSSAIANADIDAADIGLVSGHLTGTMGDRNEVANWAKVLQRYGDGFPYINTAKSMIGHCLSGAGSIECIATVLQLYNQVLHPNINCEHIHPEILETISSKCIPVTTTPSRFNLAVKANFGFGDANSCLIFKKM
jgi:3-oxoacyl-[acyl-carrier-protein] synthase I